MKKWQPILALFMMISPLSNAGTGTLSPDVAAFYPSTSKRLAPEVVDDLAFLRRVYLDITGKLPDETATTQFLNATGREKRADVIEELLDSEAYVARMTSFFRDLFGNRLLTDYAYFRNSFHNNLREKVSANQGWDEMARDLLTAGDLGAAPRSNFFLWAKEANDQDFRLDYLDDQVGFITETMLGLRTNCISCHDGAYHLEEVNKGLSVLTREQFWGMAAFVSSTFMYSQGYAGDNEVNFLRSLQIIDGDDRDFEEGEGYLLAEERYHDGEYRASSVAGDGMRSPRYGGLVEPAYLISGEQPQAGETRRAALARILTDDRQFARNMVNRIWAHFFGEGFVEPLDDWDLGRLDDETATSFNTDVQARNPELVEQLTDDFIESGYDIKELIRILCNSELYQWDFRNSEQTHSDSLGYWRGQQRSSRLDAESIVDGIRDILGFRFKYMYTGKLDQVFYSTWDMPDNLEPNPGAIFDFDREEPLIDVRSLGYDSLDLYFYIQFATKDLLDSLGRGDYTSMTPRRNESSVPSILTMLNSEEHYFWLENWEYSPTLVAMVQDIYRGQQTAEAAGLALFRRTLYREPQPAELAMVTAHMNEQEPGPALADIAWALFNHPEFLYR